MCKGLGVISGKGFECVLTLGTGIGSSFFYNGRLLPHLELGQHPLRGNLTYDHYIGDAVRRGKGRKKWNARLKKALAIVATLVNYDTLYLGGGNAQRIDFKLPTQREDRRPTSTASPAASIYGSVSSTICSSRRGPDARVEAGATFRCAFSLRSDDRMNMGTGLPSATVGPPGFEGERRHALLGCGFLHYRADCGIARLHRNIRSRPPKSPNCCFSYSSCCLSSRWSRRS